jgi:hypothetical protein
VLPNNFSIILFFVETRKASFKPIAEPVYKPISSVLEKIRLRKMEILKMSVLWLLF